MNRNWPWAFGWVTLAALFASSVAVRADDQIADESDYPWVRMEVPASAKSAAARATKAAAQANKAKAAVNPASETTGSVQAAVYERPAVATRAERQASVERAAPNIPSSPTAFHRGGARPWFTPTRSGAPGADPRLASVPLEAPSVMKGLKIQSQATTPEDISGQVVEEIPADGPAVQITPPEQYLGGPGYGDGHPAAHGPQYGGWGGSWNQPEYWGPGWGYAPICHLAGLVDNLQVAVGAHGFKGPIDLGDNGNFGFDYGFNLGGPLYPACGWGWQFGANFVHSDFSGYTVGPLVSSDSRFQSFGTVGVFRRALAERGLQGGVAWDWLHDDYYDKFNVNQLRGELSYVYHCVNEVGVWVAINAGDDQVQDPFSTFENTLQVETRDLYAVFCRRQIQCGGEGRLFAGVSGNGDGLLGGDLRMPLSDSFTVQTAVTYLIPEENGTLARIQNETWGIGVNLIWTPRCRAREIMANPFRPLFDVANNTNLLTWFKN